MALIVASAGVFAVCIVVFNMHFIFPLFLTLASCCCRHRRCRRLCSELCTSTDSRRSGGTARCFSRVSSSFIILLTLSYSLSLPVWMPSPPGTPSLIFLHSLCAANIRTFCSQSVKLFMQTDTQLYRDSDGRICVSASVTGTILHNSGAL